MTLQNNILNTKFGTTQNHSWSVADAYCQESRLFGDREMDEIKPIHEENENGS